VIGVAEYFKRIGIVIIIRFLWGEYHMLEWVSKKHRDQKHKDEQEALLKNSLAEKVQRFQSSHNSENIGYTELTINGKRLRVFREHITIPALSPITQANPG